MIELLATITIIGIMAAMAMSGLYTAQERAKEARTKSIIIRLNSELSARYELYRTRRLPIDASSGRDPGNSAVNNSGVLSNPDSGVQYPPNTWSPNQDDRYVTGAPGYPPIPNTTLAQQVSLKSLYARRELMRREMPDRYQDILILHGSVGGGIPTGINDVTSVSTTPPTQFLQSTQWPIAGCVEPMFLARELDTSSPLDNTTDIVIPIATPLMLAYQRMVNTAIQYVYLKQNPPPPAAPTPGATINDTPTALAKLAETYESAECLYMILSASPAEDFTGRSLFNENETGDVDDDGMKEFLDGWGRPIEWIRWPAGFVSALQPAISPGTPAPATYYINTVPVRDVANNRDGFDSRGVSIFLYNADSPAQSRRVNVPPDDDGTTADNLFADATSVPNSQNWSWGFYTTPLIVSSGPDKQFGLLMDRRGLTYPDALLPGVNPNHLLTSPAGLNATDQARLRKLADPYSLHPYTTDGTTLSYGQIGTIINYVSGGGNVEQVHLDNIDNHSLEVR